MNDNTYFKPCTKCGRPQTFCKGECCGKPQGCQCQEYGPKACGCIRQKAPECPYEAVIPSVTVESVSNLKDLADCFVHVSDINTTFYIDDKHRIMTTWAGLVSVEDYDFEANPLNLRGQIAYDAKNNVAAIYDKQGANYIFQISDIDNDYMLLGNKPAINGVTLEGNKSLNELGIPAIEEVALAFDTVADMKASTNLVAGSYAQTLGFHTLNDGGGATYYITNTGTANEMDTIVVGSLYAVLVNGKNVKQYGAYGDGTHDDSAIIQYVINTIKDVYIPDGTYMVNPVLDNVNKVGIKLTNNSKLTLSPNAELKAIPNSQTNYVILSSYGASNIEISGGKITGDRTEHTGSTGEWGHCIAITNESDNIKLKNIIISNAWGDGVYINDTSNVVTDGLTVDNCRRNGISVIKVDGYHSLNDVITNSNGTKPENGIDIEPNHSDDIVRNVRIDNLTTYNNAGSALQVYLQNLDATYPVDIKINGHYDKGSLNGANISKSTTVTGLVELNNSYYEDSQAQGIVMKKCYYSPCKVMINRPYILNCNTDESTAPATGSSISMYLDPGDAPNNIGNLVIREPYTINASGAIATSINCSTSNASIQDVTIINPLNNDSKYIFIDGTKVNVNLEDKYKQCVLDNASSLGNLSNSRYYSEYTNESATGNIGVTVNAGLFAGRELKFTNLSDGHRLRIFMPSGQYVKQLSDTAQPTINLEKLGDSITLKKYNSTLWIVTAMVGEPTLG